MALGLAASRLKLSSAPFVSAIRTIVDELPTVCCQETPFSDPVGDRGEVIGCTTSAEPARSPTSSFDSAPGRPANGDRPHGLGRPFPWSCFQPGRLRRVVNRLKGVAVQQPVREGSTNQLATLQFSQVKHVRYRDTPGSLSRRPAIDTLMATSAVPMGPVLVEKPLQLLASGDANVVEQLEA